MNTLLARLDRPAIARHAAVPASAALIAVAIVHIIDGPGSLSDQFYIGALEFALTAACVPLAIALVVRPTRDLWITTAALVGLALLLYLLSRTTGLPGSTDDIGNWGQALGIVSLATEAAVLAIAGWAFARDRVGRQSPDAE
jgi:hypothetical protein